MSATVDSVQGFSPVPQSQWPDASKAKNCQMDACRKSFGLMGKGSNCYGCGRVCCSACLSQSMVIPGFVTSPSRPVCSYCAVAIAQAWEEQSNAAMRCRVLQHILTEQTSQLEELTQKSSSLRDENEALLGVKRKLEVDIELLKMESSTSMRSHNNEASPPQLQRSASMITKFASPTTTTGSSVDASASPQDLAKKKTQLDIREASLNEAKKKIAADNAKLVKERERVAEEESWILQELQGKAQVILHDHLVDLKALAIAQIEKDTAELHEQLRQLLSSKESPAPNAQHEKELKALQKNHIAEIKTL
ncbi:Hypothetical protein, putative, partial [Bodo saltans]